MSFKHEFLTALKGGKDYPALLELARRQHTQGRQQQETYQILQEIWLEFGFDTSPDVIGNTSASSYSSM